VLPLPFVVILSEAFSAESKDLALAQFILRRHPEAVHSEGSAVAFVECGGSTPPCFSLALR
jgi:hypothetical protein